MNTLHTILDDQGVRSEVQRWLYDRWLTRASYEAGMAHTKYAEEFTIKDNSGQYLEAYRQNEPRRPQKLDTNNPTSDPLSGMTLGDTKVTAPMDFVQEYAGLSTVAQWTSIHDIRRWADTDLVRAYKKRRHELVQNAIKVGRFKPGKWAADGTASVAFDTTQELTFDAWGVTFTAVAGHRSFAGRKASHQHLKSGDNISLRDFDREASRLTLRHAPKIKNRFVAYISCSTKEELMKDDRYMEYALKYKGQGIDDNQISDYKGWHWIEDDMPFCEGYEQPLVRREFGPIHTAFCFGASSFAILKLGSKSRVNPTFKVQDVSATGVYKTIGYLVPGQEWVIHTDWCGTITGPVDHWDPDEL